MRAKFLKRAIDVVGSLSGLFILSPLILAVAIAVGVVMGRPILFRQSRPGMNGHRFRILKFRTMVGSPGDDDHLDLARLTKLGRFLRRTSIDELPELLNVLKGDMSLIGPRPLLQQYLPLYTSEQARRHEVRPGVTGWAQVNGRNTLTWEEKFALDVWYVDNWSLTLDFKILSMTLVKVIKGQGISAEGHATVPRFTGSAELPQ
jgi:sugar transferase EpsL